MNSLVLTTFPERKRICLVADFFIVHEPRKTILNIGGKPAFNQTTFMSVFNPTIMNKVVEDYQEVASAIVKKDNDFAEFRHFHTGTMFLLNPRFFELIEKGTVWPDGNGIAEKLSLVSLWNPGLWVEIDEPSFESACAKMGHELD
jgi:hypothetical protein